MSAHALINTLVRIEMSIAIFRFPKHGKVADNAQVFETSRTTSRTHSKGYGTRGRDPADWRWRTYPIPGRVRSNISVSGAPGVLLSDRNRFAWRGSGIRPAAAFLKRLGFFRGGCDRGRENVGRTNRRSGHTSFAFRSLARPSP